MTLYSDLYGNFTPVFNSVVSALIQEGDKKPKVLGWVRGGVLCKIFLATNLRDKVCRMGQARIAREMGLDRTTVQKQIKWAVAAGLVVVSTPPTPKDPAELILSPIFYDLAAGQAITTARGDLITPPGDLITPPGDLITQEEDQEEDQKRINDPIFDFFLNNISPAPGQITIDWLKKLASTYSEQDILNALETMRVKGAKSLAYAEAILKSRHQAPEPETSQTFEAELQEALQ